MSPNNGLIFRVLRAECELTTSQKMVLLVLLNHWNPNNAGSVVWPGQPRIAAHARLTVRTAQRVLQQLEQMGLIKIRIESGKSNRYTLNIDVIDAMTPDTTSGVPTTNEQEPLTPCRDTPDTMSYECLKERPINPLRHSSKRQREMSLLADILPNALQK